MSDKPLSKVQARELRNLEPEVLQCLRERFGAKEYYTSEEVDAACDQCGVRDLYKPDLKNTFVEPEHTGGFLQKLAGKKWVRSMRVSLAGDVAGGVPGGSLHDHSGHGDGFDSWGSGDSGASDGGGDGE